MGRNSMACPYASLHVQHHSICTNVIKKTCSATGFYISTLVTPCNGTKVNYTHGSILFRWSRVEPCMQFTVETLMSRVEALSSSGVERAQEEKEVTGELKENGYPSSFVYKHSCPSRPRPDREEQRPKTTLTLPYISNLSEAIRRVLTPLDIQVVFRPLTTLRVPPKDRVPMDEQKGVDYSIPCTECPKVYIGQTGRSLKHRLKEHQRALRNGDMAASALAEHALLQAMVWTSVRQRCSTATHTPQHGACLRVGTFSRMRISSTENGETFLKCTRHSWSETYHSYTPCIIMHTVLT